MEKRRIRRFYDHLYQTYGQLYGAEQRAKHKEVMMEIEIEPDDRVLDVGCGDGQFIRRLAQDAGFAIGLDLSPKMISNAKRLLRSQSNCELVIGDASYLPLRDSSIQMSTAITVILDTISAPRALSEIRRIVADGGKFVLSYVSRGKGSSGMLPVVIRIFGQEWKLRRVNLDNDTRLILRKTG